MSRRKSKVLSQPAPIAAPRKARKARANKGAPKALSAPTPASSNGNGKHAETLAQTVESVGTYLLKCGDLFAQQCTSVADCVTQYRGFFAGTGADQARVAADVYSPAGFQIGRIDTAGRFADMNGRINLDPRTPEEITPPQQSASVQEEVQPAASIGVPVNFLQAALSVAPKKDTRYYLNGVYVHTLGKDLRIVATDGHRMLVMSQTIDKELPWGADGVILPREELGRLMAYVSKGDDAEVQLSFGVRHPFAKMQVGDGAAVFTLTPIDGKFPDYTRVLDQASNVFTAVKDVGESTMVDAAYLKSAGAVSAQLGSKSICAHVGRSSDQVMFTFESVPGAVLVVMPMRTGQADVIAPSTARLIGSHAIKGTVAALRAHRSRVEESLKTAKGKEREDLKAKITGYDVRIDGLLAAISTQLEGPKAPEAEEEVAEQKNA